MIQMTPIFASAVILLSYNNQSENYSGGNTMGGGDTSTERVDHNPSERPQPEFNVDLSRLHDHILAIEPNLSGTAMGFDLTNQGPIASISLPPGWTEEPRPARGIFQVRDGYAFVPPDHAENPYVSIHITDGLRQPVPQETERALRSILALRSAQTINGPQELTDLEKRALHQLISPSPNFSVTDAQTVVVQGKTALKVDGYFATPSGPGAHRETIFIADDRLSHTGVKQVYLAAPQDTIHQYKPALDQTFRSIRWAS